MKDIFVLWVCQTSLILFLKHITTCYAVGLSELDSFVSSNFEEPDSNNRRGYYGDPDNVSKTNQYFETAYTDADRRTSQQDFGRAGGGTKFTKPANQRKPLYSESRKAYAAALGYSKTRNGDTSEIDSAMAGASSAENGDSNDSILNDGGLTNNTAFGSVSALVKSNFPKQPQQLGKDSCTCQGSGANEEVSFLCFSSRDGSKNLSIKYKGTIIFDLEDILKGYKLYFDSMQVNIENVLNSESNFKNEFDGDSKLNIDISKFKINGGKFNAENKFDINKIKKGDSKFKLSTFDKYDMNTIKEDSNKFNFEINKNGGLDIQKYFKGNNKFKTQFDKNTNINAQIEAWKKIQEMAESKTNSKFSLNNNFKGNQFSYEADAQAEIEAHAKALAEAEALTKAQAIFQAQMEAEAKAQAVLKNQITAQAVEAQAKARAEAKAQAEANAKAQMQINGMGQAQVNSQSHAISFSDDHNGNNFVNLGVGGEKKVFGNGGFSLGFNGAIGATKFGTSYGKQTGGAYSFGGGTGGAIGIGGGAGGAIGIGGGAGGAIGIGGGAGGAFGIGGGSGGGIGIGRPFSGKPMVVGNDGQTMGTVMTYTGSEFNYGDDLYDESLDDGALSIGYPGVLAFPTPNDSPVSSGRLYNNGRIQKDGYTSFGVSGYQRYP